MQCNANELNKEDEAMFPCNQYALFVFMTLSQYFEETIFCTSMKFLFQARADQIRQMLATKVHTN